MKLTERVRSTFNTTASFLSRSVGTAEQTKAWLDLPHDGMAKVLAEHQGRSVHKWMHFPDIYERYFHGYRGSDVRMLEIGVSHGGSLELWRKYFGEKATIFGVDINPACANRFDPPNQVRIGSQADPEFLRSVVAEMGAPDIILDDGSHVGEHQRISFETLFPLLREGGLYAIEDLHTAYWPGEWEGGYRRPGSGIEQVKQMIDDMHGWYHDKPQITSARTEIGAIHVHDSVVVIEKTRRDPPTQITMGTPALA